MSAAQPDKLACRESSVDSFRSGLSTCRTTYAMCRVCQVAIALGDAALFNDVHAGKETLRALLANRAALLVLDDVWRRSDADAFDVLGPRCAYCTLPFEATNHAMN